MSTDLIWQDHFTDADGTNLSAHSPDVGTSYNLWSGATQATIQANRVSYTTAGFSNAKYNLVGMTQRNVVMKAKFRIDAFGTYAGVLCVARTDLGGDHYVSIGAYKIAGQAGVFLDAAQGFSNIYKEELVTLNTGQEYELEAIFNGHHFIAKLDGVVVLEVDSFLASDVSGFVGLWFRVNGSTVSVDDFSVEEVFPMISLRSGQWNAHREGVAELLKAAGQALCDGTALALTAEIRLWTSANAPGCDDAVADYTEATFSGYAPVLIDPGDGGCTDILEVGVNEDGVGQIVIDQQAWTEGNPATITETVNGAYLVIIDGANELLLGTFLFPDPVNMGTAGDILKVGGFMLLDCQMVPVA